jgi:LPXTG-motif cell wall-anchored protein
MNGPTRSWRRPGLFIGSAAAGLIAVGLCTTPASAHTPNWSVTCSEVTVDLTAYNGGVKNTVSVTVDGKDLLAPKTFGSEYHDKLTLPEHSSELSVHLVVKAGDGDRFSRDETKTAPVCASTSPASASPSPSKPSKPSPSPTEAAPAPSASSASAAPVPSSKPTPSDLAETGSSSSTPIIAGAAAVVVVAGGGILLATRKRGAAARH